MKKMEIKKLFIIIWTQITTRKAFKFAGTLMILSTLPSQQINNLHFLFRNQKAILLNPLSPHTLLSIIIPPLRVFTKYFLPRSSLSRACLAPKLGKLLMSVLCKNSSVGKCMRNCIKSSPNREVQLSI